MLAAAPAEDRAAKPRRYLCTVALLIAFAGAGQTRESDLGSRFSTDGLQTVDCGRILLAGARLQAPNLPGGVKGSDYGIARLNGDGIFSDGIEF